jgi:hypothetical protein
MPFLHVVKEGVTSDNASITKSFYLEIEALLSAFSDAKRKFFITPPRINTSKVAKDSDPYRYVVLEVRLGEESEEFPKVGFYWILNITVKEASERIGKPIPRI